MSGEKRRNFLVNFAYFGVITFIVVALVRYALPMLAPLVIALVIAYMLRPLVRIMRDKLRLRGKFAPALCVTLFYAVIGMLVSWLGVKTVMAVIELIKMMPTLYDTHMLPFFTDVKVNLERFFTGLDPAASGIVGDLGNQLISSLGEMISDISVAAMGFASNFAYALPGLFIELVLLIISTYFIAMDYEMMRDFCLRQLSPKVKETVIQIKEYVVGTLLVCIRSYAIIMAITFVELSIGLYIVGIKHAVLTSLCISIFDVLPVLGTGGVMIPWVVLTLIQGSIVRAVGLLIVYVVVTIIRNIIEPKIVGKQLGLHPMVTLASMFVGLELLGVVGLFGFPIGLSLLCYLNDRGVINVLN